MSCVTGQREGMHKKFLTEPLNYSPKGSLLVQKKALLENVTGMRRKAAVSVHVCFPETESHRADMVSLLLFTQSLRSPPTEHAQTKKPTTIINSSSMHLLFKNLPRREKHSGVQ